MKDFLSSIAAVDWRSYLDWHMYTGWRAALLAASVALLVVALLVRATRDARADKVAATRVPLRDEVFLRRIGTMPIEPPDSLELVR